jgi:cell division protein FtsN
VPRNPQPVYQVTRKGVFAWGCLMLFVAAWMFLLGVLVGRGTAPIRFDIDQLQRSLLAKREAAGQQQRERLARETQNGKNQTELDFYEFLKSPKNDDQLSAPAAAKESQPAAEAKAPKVIRPKVPAKRLRPASSQAPEPSQPAAAPAKDPSPPGRFTIQVASLKEARWAEEMVAKLVKKGYPAYSIRTVVSGKTWYRVRIGGFQERREADNLISQLKKEKMSPIIVNR